MKKNPTIFLCGLLLASCVVPNTAGWPDSIPQQQLFINAYNADKENQNRQLQTEYLQWTLSFYQGNPVYQSGWQDIQGYIIEAPASQSGEQLDDQLIRLGVAIGSEWAKHNDIRRINTRLLSLWGSTIQLAPDFTKQQQLIEVIAEDVNQLLNGSLARQDIMASRYAEILGVELFGCF